MRGKIVVPILDQLFTISMEIALSFHHEKTFASTHLKRHSLISQKFFLTRGLLREIQFNSPPFRF